MGSYPDGLGDCPGLFPTAKHLRAEARDRLTDRQAAALRRVAALVDEFQGYLATEDGAGADDVADTERVAAALDALIGRVWPASRIVVASPRAAAA